MPSRSSNAAPKQSGESRRQSGQNRLRAAGFTSTETAPSKRKGKKIEEATEPVEDSVKKDAVSESIDQPRLATVDDTLESEGVPSTQPLSPKDSEMEESTNPVSNEPPGNDQTLEQEAVLVKNTDHEDQVKPTGEPTTALISEECTEVAPTKSTDHEDQVTSTGNTEVALAKSTEQEDLVKSSGEPTTALISETCTEVAPVKSTDHEDQVNSTGEPTAALVSAVEPSSDNSVSASFKIDQPLLCPAVVDSAEPALSAVPSGRVKGRKRAAIKNFFRRSLLCFA